MTSRREILKKMSAGMALSVVATGVSKSQAVAAFANGTSLDSAPWWLLSPLKEGSSVGKGWVLDSLGPIEQGAAILTLRHADGRFQNIHLCVHDGEPKGLAHTSLLDLVLMDGGQGDKPTDESLGRVLMGLAKRIEHNELAGVEDLTDLASLQTHAQRVERYGPENLI